MTVEELLIDGYQHLHKDQVRMLLGDLLGYNPLELLNHLGEEVDEKTRQIYQKSIDALLTNKPIQYVLGNVNFYGNRFKVNENVLIPRFETEELVEHTLHYLDTYFPGAVRVLDLGCGSGVIGITLKKKRPQLDVTMLDISPSALEVAKENAKELNANVTFMESDMFQKVEGTFDVIISNPPYIKEEEEIDPLVKDNEPPLALYAGKDGLDCYRKILKDVKKHLNKRYLLAFEIGCDQKEAVEELINQYLDNVSIEIKKDLQGRNRMVFVWNNDV